MRLQGSMENRQGKLWVGGVSVEDLVAKYGTPLYIYDEERIRSQCAAIVEAGKQYPKSFKAYYASKAFPNAAVERIVHGQGLGIDAASEGEMRVALMAGVPAEDILLHGAYKTDAFLELGISRGAGRIVVDSFGEIARIQSIAARLGKTVQVLMRINPGIEAETHEAVRTADLDVKFGFPLLEGEALRATAMLKECSHIRLRGVHCHVGSQVFKMDVFDLAAQMLLEFMQKAGEVYGAPLDELNLGGGFGAYYKESDTPKEMQECVQTITHYVQKHAKALGMELPSLMIEPGRAIVAEAAVSVYTVGMIKEIPGINTYVVIDGGLFENPRPQLYGSVYTAFLPNRMDEPAERTYTVSGFCCETDTLIKKSLLPDVKEGDLLAFLTAGAYQAAMASNYQRTPRPAIVLVRDGQSHMIQRRQTIEDVLAFDVLP